MKTKFLHFARLKNLSALLFIVFALHAHAQVNYVYDNNGNRTSDNNGDEERMINPNKVVSTYPNPTIKELFVSIPSLNKGGEAMVYLVNTKGATLITKDATSSPIPMDLAPYPQGEYYVKVVMNYKEYYYKVEKTGETTTKTKTTPKSDKPGWNK